MTDVLTQCKRIWRRLGVPDDVAADMAAELEVDLAAAADEGVTADTYVGRDARSFAAAWATERGVARPPLRIALTTIAAVVGAVPGVGLALFVAYGLSSEAMAEILTNEVIRVGENVYRPYFEPPEWMLPLLYGVGAVFAYAGAVAAVGAALHWRLDPATTRTVHALVFALPLATAVAIGASVLFSWTRGFSTDGAVVLGDVLVAAAVFASSVGLTRVVAVGRERVQLSAVSV